MAILVQFPFPLRDDIPVLLQLLGGNHGITARELPMRLPLSTSAMPRECCRRTSIKNNEGKFSF
ncbi:unknown protein [Microcystis aeruginosa NIES-843]|uniref:Uncharacterized protein n=1 Tax=Microcystis aeruginosa (strain NIES-843 / IAM M-2473) TaxID=449447 RepID=B0JVA3_MICAN|nr:unknown protein [Microcystis aeruginosa NIES-843]